MAVPMIAFVTKKHTTFTFQYLPQCRKFLACSASFHMSFEDLLELVGPAGPSSLAPRFRIAESLAVLIRQTMFF